MKLNSEGYDLICKFEGLMLKPYLCSAGVPTIGYGNTFYPNGTKVTLADPSITKEYALEIFKFIADTFAKNVNALITSNVTQNQFNALVSFAYNVGIGALKSYTLLKKVNINPNDASIALEFAKWNKANRKVVLGLTKRRTAESALYFK